MRISSISLSVLFCAIAAMAADLQYQVLRPGSGDPVKAGQLVRVHYTGWLADSTRFDSSRDREQPLEFALGAGQVIAGWDQGIVGMQVGELRRLVVPANLGYGDKSVGPIPANSTLIFEVELMGADKALDPDVLPADLTKRPWKMLQQGLDVFDEKTGAGSEARPGVKVVVHYSGWLANGSKFGSSKDLGKPIDGMLGAGKFIKGWEKGLEGLQPGTVRWLRIAPSLAYGSAALARIPPNSTLIFRVEGVAVEADEDAAGDMDFFPDTAKVAWQEGPEGLRYAIVKEGTPGNPAIAGAKVKVHYTGWLTDGTRFDSSRDRQMPFEFPLGAGRVVRGWDLGVAGMLPGEKRLLLIPPGLGYGNRGGGPIPPDATLVFAVEYLGED